MNWKEIKKKYPKAHDKAINYFCNNPSKEDLRRLYFCDTMIHTGNNDRWQVTFNIRYLYDFFDDQEIIISILKVYLKDYFWFKINDIHSMYDLKLKDIKGRKEVEEIAFLKTFEILENNLIHEAQIDKP